MNFKKLNSQYIDFIKTNLKVLILIVFTTNLQNRSYKKKIQEHVLHSRPNNR